MANDQEQQALAPQVETFIQDISKVRDQYGQGIITGGEFKNKLIDRLSDELMHLLDLEWDEEGKITVTIQRRSSPDETPEV
tara:strand:+ start:181 stop:423 length:243 start_codon:yes stop_codon:yes gene_type:complete